MPDDVYHKARVIAAERKSSVSRMVADYLTDLSHESEFERLKRMGEELIAEIRSRPAVAVKRMTRDEVHDRRALRGH